MMKRGQSLLVYLECDRQDGTIKMDLNVRSPRDYFESDEETHDVLLQNKTFKDSHEAAEYIEKNILRGMRYGRP